MSLLFESVSELLKISQDELHVVKERHMNIILNIYTSAKQYLTKQKVFLQHMLPNLIFTEMRLIGQMNIICIL